MSWFEEIRSRLDRPWPDRTAQNEAIGTGGPLREAAVLVPLYVRDKTLFTLFTKRTDQVEHHKGQISFPGGKRHDGDENLWATARRETEEEIGIPAASARLLGTLPPLVTVTDFRVTPFVGAVPYPLQLTLAEGEVESVLEVPMAYLLEPAVVEERPIEWKGRKVMTLVYHYRGHAIWGATARILTDLLEVMKGPPPDAR